MTLQDSEIVDALFLRDESALGEARKKYGAYLLKIAKNILGDCPECEEALDDLLLGLWNSVPPNRPEELLPWLSKLMRRKALDILRKRHRQKRLPPGALVPLDELAEAIPSGSDPEKEIDLKLLAAALNAWLGGLSPKKRELFLSRAFYSEPVSEIAKRLGRSEASVKSELHRLREDLKKYLAKQGLY